LRAFCFSLGLAAALSACRIWAAGAPEPSGQITSVVRADVRTGKLVRSVVVTPKNIAGRRVEETVVAPRVVTPSLPTAEPLVPPAGIEQAVEQIAAQHSLSPALIHSVIKVESNYDPHAVSPKGALGLMQLIPSTARRFGVTDVFNPVENIQGGARYLKYLLNLFGGSYSRALAAYNAGEAAVARYRGVPPFSETQNYLVRVLQQWERMAASKPPEPAKRQTHAEPDGTNHIQEVVEADGRVRYVNR